ncbi:unnamed protein product [Closterium sp. NIES-53]
MATPSVLTFDAEGRVVDFEVWVDDLQLFLQCDRADGLSLFDLTSGASPAPPAIADSTVRSQWATRDDAARLAVRRHLPTTERAHFCQYKSAQTLYDAVVACYYSPATAALSYLMLLYLFPDLAAFPTFAELITHLLTSDTHYRTALPAEFCAKNPPTMYITLYYIVTRLPGSLRLVRDHFLLVCPTTLTVDLLEQRLLAAETSIVAVGASRGDPRTPVFEGCSPSPLLPSVASAAAADLGGFESLGAASAPSGRRRTGWGKGGKGTGGTSGGGGAAVEAEEAVAVAEGAEVAEEAQVAEAAQVFHTFTLDSGASRSFFRDRNTLTPLSRPIAVSLTDPSKGPVLASFSTVLPCPAAPSGTLSGLYLPSFSTNLVSGADLQDQGVDQFTPASQRVAASSQVFAAASGSGPESLPPLPPGPAPTCVPCVEGRQRAAPHSSEFPPTEAPLQTLHMDVKGDVTKVLIDWIRAARLQLRESFGSDFPVLRLHSDRGGEFSSACLGAFCRAQGIRQTFTLPASPQQKGIAERRIGMYAAHQLNIQPRVSLPETSPTLRWTGKVGDASAFRVWGSRAFVRDLSADKLSPRAVPCVFLGFPPDAPGWRFYHPTSHDVTFDKSVPYYRLFPYRTTPLPPPPLFLAPGPPPVDPLPPHGPALSGVSQVDAVEPVKVAVDSGAARGAEPVGAGSAGAESGGAEPGGAEPGGAESGGAEPGGAEPGGAKSARVASRSASSRRELREWFARRWSRAAGAGGPPIAPGLGSSRNGGTGAVGTGGAAAAAGVGPAGASGSAGAGAPGGVGAGVGAAGASGAAGAVAAGGVGTGVGPAGGTAWADGGTGAAGPAGVGAVGAGGAAGTSAATGGTGAVPVGTGGPARPRPYFVPLLEQPASRPASPVRTTRTSRRAPRPRSPAVPGTHQMTLRPSTAPLRVPLPSPPESSLPVLADPASDSLRAASPTVARLLSTVVTDPSFESTAASALVAELVDFAACCRLDYATRLVAESESVCPPSVGEPSGPYPELVGCLMYQMTCTRPDLAYPLSILARYVAPGRHRPEHMAAAKRVLRYLCSTSGMGLVLGGRRPVVLTGHADASWADDQATQQSSHGYTFSLGSDSVLWRSTRSSSWYAGR